MIELIGMLIGGLIINIFPVCFVLLVVGLISYQSYLEGEKATVWQSLAASEGWDFIRGSWLGEKARVAGNYRGHRLRLETFQKGQGRSSRTYTRVVLFVDHSPNGRHSPNGHYPTRSRLSSKPEDGLDEQLEVENLLKRLTPTGSGCRLRGEVKVGGGTIYYEQPSVECNEEYLWLIFDLLGDLADAYPKLVTLGGEIVPALHEIALDNNHNLQKVASHLLHEIGRETTTRLAHRAQHLSCLRCLGRCRPHKLPIGWTSITYYGCRACGQSQDFMAGRIVAVLDSQMATTLHRQKRVLRVSWLTCRMLFDFDEVEIRQATDEDVERFAVQVGNDTDPMRQPYYKEMRCLISPGCQLSQNTRRILQKMFGQVEVGEPAKL